MRTAILAVTLVALAATTQAANAQSMTDSAQAPFTWSGAYLGLNAGGVFDGKTKFDRTSGVLTNNTTALNLGLRPTQQTTRDSGFVGGGQIGFNLDPVDLLNGLMGDAAGRIVLGVEADAAYTDLDHTETLSNTTLFGPLDVPSLVPFTRVNQYSSELKYLGTVRGRLGVTFGEALVYGTGGLAYGDVRQQVTFFGPNAPTTPFFQGSNQGTKTGYAYGGGVEFAMPVNGIFNTLNFFNSSAVTIKAEFLHYDLGRDTITIPGLNGGATIGGYTSQVRTSGNLVRAGINYKL